MSDVKSFSVASLPDKPSENPFGSDYAGEFSLRRPSLLDKRNIALKEASQYSMYGNISPDHVDEGVKFLSYIITYVSEIATKPLPEWFAMDKVITEKDERAIMAVWQEVTAFLESFRSE